MYFVSTNATLTHNVNRTNSPFAAPAVAPVKEVTSGHAQMRGMNRRECYLKERAMRLQGHYGRRITVRDHTTPIKTPINAVYRSGENSIMVELALAQERVFRDLSK